MDGRLEERHRRHRQLEQRLLGERPAVWLDRPERVGEAAEQRLASLLLLGAELALREEIRASERIEDVRKGRCVVRVAAFAQHLERRPRHAVARAAKTVHDDAGGLPDRVFGTLELAIEIRLAVQMQPWLVVEAVIADFMAGLRDAAQRGAVLLERRVLPDDEEREAKPPIVQELEDAWHDQVEVAREIQPGLGPMRLEIRPLVVEVQREAHSALAHGFPNLTRWTLEHRSRRATSRPPRGP